MKGRRNPVKSKMEKYHKPKTHTDKVKAYRKRKAREKANWNLDDELYEVPKRNQDD